MTYDIENQLLTLKPAGQTNLARRILETQYRRRQRHRDCFVALGGLLTGIAATLLVVVMVLPDQGQGRYPTAVAGTSATAGMSPIEDVYPAPQSTTADVAVRQSATYTEYRLNDIDLDAMFARYEKLLRNRPIVAHKPVVYTPVLMPGGVSPMEYRQKLLDELGNI
jgi:hypothetical protein